MKTVRKMYGLKRYVLRYYQVYRCKIPDALDSACDQIIAGLSCVRKTTFRVNTLKSSPDRVEAALAQAGLRYDRTAGLPDAYEMPGGSEEALRTLSVYDQGEIYLQSLSSMP